MSGSEDDTLTIAEDNDDPSSPVSKGTQDSLSTANSPSGMDEKYDGHQSKEAIGTGREISDAEDNGEGNTGKDLDDKEDDSFSDDDVVRPVRRSNKSQIKENSGSDRNSDSDPKSDSAPDSDIELPDIPPPSSKPRAFDQLFKNSDVYGGDSSSEDDRPKKTANRYRSKSEGDDSDNNKSSDSDEGVTAAKKKASKEKRPPVRKASAKAREKTIQELTSKTQQLTRESRISLPYSKPKQMTLDEFLKKRREAKKTILTTIISTPSLGSFSKGFSVDDDLFIEPEKPQENSIPKLMEEDLNEINTAESSFLQDDFGISDQVQVTSSKVNEDTDNINIGTPVPGLLNEDMDKMDVEEENPVVASEKFEIEEEIGKPTRFDFLNKSDGAGDSSNNPQVEPKAPENGDLSCLDNLEIPQPVSSVEGEKMNSSKSELDADAPESSKSHVYDKQEAELESYLESLKPKPKRKSIKEMLMSLPEFKSVANLKPKIGGGKKDKVIDLNVAIDRKPKDIKRHQQIEDLKDRFVRHVITAPPKHDKVEHIKLKIKKKEEDSQGIEHLVENELDYIRNPLNEEDDAMNFLSTPQSASPQASAPGAQRSRLQSMLMGKIRAKKIKEHEERRKIIDAYNEEIDAEDKEEIEEICSEDESDVEDEDESEVEDEEEELEYLLSASSKKRKKSAFVEDEAEDEDGSDGGGNEDEDDDDETDVTDNEDDQSKIGEDKVDENDELASIGNSEDSLPAGQIPTNKVVDTNQQSKLLEMENGDSENMNFSIHTTPKVTKAILNQRTPSDFWIPAKTNGSRQPELSPLIPRLPKKFNVNDAPKENCSSIAVPVVLSTVISETNDRFDDLVDLCSGKFLSQVNPDNLNTQDDKEFGGFDFGEDDDEFMLEVEEGPKSSEKSGENVEERISTPAPNMTRTAFDGITPKLSEKISKTRLLMQFDEEADIGKDASEPTNSLNDIESVIDEEDDDDEIFNARTRIRKKKRLQFSDDEEDETEANPHVSEDEEEAEEEESPHPVPAEKPKLSKFQSLFYNKEGCMKRKFVEDEAELSGSDEGSGDEDEKGLNHYEKEDGDDEELDEDALHTQVERAHLKQLLDDDDRKIRHLQNKYLETGDMNIDKQRERKFRWLSMNEIDDEANMGDSDEEQIEDNPQEVSQKEEYLAKRKWLSENSHLMESDKDESQSLFNNSRFLRVGKNTLKRIESFIDTSTSESKDVVIGESSNHRRSIYDEIIKAKNEAKSNTNSMSCSEGMDVGSASNQGDMASKSMSQPAFGEISWTKKLPGEVKRGSFLSRGGTILAKLAEQTKTGDAVSNIKTNSRNFVFSHITPPNADKTDGSSSRVKRINVGKSTKCGMQAKKMKIDRAFCNLDDASKEASIFKYL